MSASAPIFLRQGVYDRCYCFVYWNSLFIDGKIRLATLELGCLLLKQLVFSKNGSIIKDVHLACLEVSTFLSDTTSSITCLWVLYSCTNISFLIAISIWNFNIFLLAILCSESKESIAPYSVLSFAVSLIITSTWKVNFIFSETCMSMSQQCKGNYFWNKQAQLSCIFVSARTVLDQILGWRLWNGNINR